MLWRLTTYLDKGGSQAMITVINRGDLERALEEPEQYKDVFVRVGGFSARYVDLPSEHPCTTVRAFVPRYS